MVDDLWPDVNLKPTTQAPYSILREQAALLGKKTRNVVEAEVSRIEGVSEFTYRFSLVSPVLGSYEYELFSVRHGVVFYPLYVKLDTYIREELRTAYQPDNTGWVPIRSEEEFIKLLRDVFNSQRTRQVIQAILAQAPPIHIPFS